MIRGDRIVLLGWMASERVYACKVASVGDVRRTPGWRSVCRL